MKSFPQGGKFLAFEDLLEAADEIERLRRNTGCARNQRSTQFCAEALDAQREVEKLRKELSEAHYDYRRLMTQMLRERDEARRMVCSAYALQGRDIATERGWDCLKEGWDCGEEDQIPEAL